MGWSGWVAGGGYDRAVMKSGGENKTLDLPCSVHVATLPLMLSLVEGIQDGWSMTVKISLLSFRAKVKEAKCEDLS